MANICTISPKIPSSHSFEQVYEIEQRLHIVDRGPKVLVVLWLKKLCASQSTNTTVSHLVSTFLCDIHQDLPLKHLVSPSLSIPCPLQFKKNRNAYARLLLEMLGRSRIEDPFDKRPPEGPLPQMPSWLVSSLCSPGRNRRPGPGPTSPLDPLKLNQTRALFQQRDATYDAYRGRTSSATAASLPSFNNYNHVSGSVGPGSSRVGRGSGVRRPLEFGSTRTQVEAELGASRERMRELEFKVGRAEDRALDTHVAYAREMAGMTARRVLTDSGRSDGTRSKLDEIIDRYERKKDAWATGGSRLSAMRPTSASVDPFSGTQSQLLADLDRELASITNGQPREEFGVLNEDESAWMKSLEEFKRQTELLKQQIHSISSAACC